MPAYKLYYFDVRGRAEDIRYMFLYGDIPFEDFRIVGTWETYKNKMPFKQVPVLEIDGKVMINESKAIGRYVAKQIGAYGNTDIEAAKIDAIVDMNADAHQKIRPVIMAKFQKDEKLEKEEWAKAREGYMEILNFYEKTLAENGNGFLVGNKLSYADFVIGEVVARGEEKLEKGLLDAMPNLKKLAQKIANLPKIKDYIATRSDTTF